MTEYENYGEIDLNLEPGELLTGLVVFNDRLWAFTDRSVYQIAKKSWFRKLWSDIKYLSGVGK